MAYDGPRALLILLLVFYFFFLPDTRGPSFSRLLDLEERIKNERSALQVLNASAYNALDAPNGRWLNITGLREGDGLAWNLLPEVKFQARRHFERAVSAAPSFATNESALDVIADGAPYGNAGKDIYSLNAYSRRIPIYSNVTSVLRGKWVRSGLEESFRASDINLTTLAPNVTYASSKFSRNITGFEGDIRLKLVDQITEEDADADPELIKKIKAELVIKDETSSGDGWDTTMYGVHYVREGSLVLSTTSEKFAGIFAIPHFTVSAPAFALSKDLLMKSLDTAIVKQKNSPDAALNPWTSTPNSRNEIIYPMPHCELIAYLQQQPVSIPNLPLEAIESELRTPTGASISEIPRIQMSAVFFSPDCGFIVKTKGPPEYPPASGSHLKGRKIEAYVKEARICVLAFAFLVCLEVMLLKRQMNEASTPSTKSRISFYTIVAMALGDGFACMSFLVAGMLVDTLFLALITTAFLSFLCVSFFGMKFLMDIWNVQAPERRERERERQREPLLRNTEAAANRRNLPGAGAASFTSQVSSSVGPPASDSLPLPATANRSNRSATPIIITPDQDLDAAEAADAAAAPLTNNPTQAITTTFSSARREIGAIYSRFYFALISLLMLSIHATSWKTTARSIYCNVISFIYLSFWTPQIYRNIMRNCRKALSWRFVIGESLLRLTPFLYCYTYEDNILFVDSDTSAFLTLAAWVWLQVFFLATQEAVGPRILVPEGWAPKAYDYYPVLREGDSENGGNMPIGFTEAIQSPTSPITTASSTAPFSPSPMGGNSARPGKKGEERSKRSFDCAICTETFQVPVVPCAGGGGGNKASAAGATTIFARRAYMVTPCRHIFHSACLEGWMRYRLQCPICREGLPPL